MRGERRPASPSRCTETDAAHSSVSGVRGSTTVRTLRARRCAQRHADPLPSAVRCFPEAPARSLRVRQACSSGGSRAALHCCFFEPPRTRAHLGGPQGDHPRAGPSALVFQTPRSWMRPRAASARFKYDPLYRHFSQMQHLQINNCIRFVSSGGVATSNAPMHERRRSSCALPL